MNSSQKQPVLAEDLYQLTSLTDPRLSPDGKKAVYVETKIKKENHQYISSLHVAVLRSKHLSQWTHGEHRDHSPRWSPDGSKLAFLSDRSGKTQLYVMSSNGGEARQLTDSIYPASAPVWSPDGKSLLFSLSISDGQAYGDLEEKDKFPEPLTVRNMSYKSDGSGFLKDRESQLFQLNMETKEIVQLTHEKKGARSAVYHPDGGRIAFVTDRSENPDLSLESHVFIQELGGEKAVQLTDGKAYFDSLSFSPDGRYLAFLGNERDYFSASSSKLYLYDYAAQTVICLTEGLDLHISDAAAGDVLYRNVYPGIQWTEDSEGFYFIASDRGSTSIHYGSIDGAVFPVRAEEEHVYGLALNPSEHTAVAGISSLTEPCELFLLDFKTGESTRLTEANKEYTSGKDISKPEAMTLKAEDGLELHGWIMKPHGYTEGEKYPLLLEIHGGPHMMYANTYMHEFQVLAAAGYCLLFINPRGSQGYGQHFADLVRGDYGGDDYRDVMAAVDHALSSCAFIDKERLGVTGGSYGGFMTNWIVGHTNRFKAAVTQRSISNWLSFYGVSDIGHYFTEWEVGYDPFDSPEKLWEHSPIKYAKNIETPLLILHSEKDYRCPIEQGEQLFIALKRLRKEAKFVRFPESSHDLSRNGHPKLRTDRLNLIKDWFEQYLK
ncbi:S9 family peptidase [Metabacillus sp. GX 13764]|uniref:S9 family peptidase n=1 Tax=Metabacillus kandeliae TaxID=2900151 RepID=UPI001E341621|nr:S9 family peptidase [Metabacillus kandeliae]MCD7036251.1 S9 family peptidase [Metabacillus kandeliae]